MKIFSLLLLFFCVMGKGWAQMPTSNLQDSVWVSGKILDYQPNADDHFITFGVYDVFGKLKRQAIQVGEDGTYAIRLYQPFEGDIEVNYKDSYLHCYVKPNVPLQLDIDDHQQQFTAKGGLAEMNNLMLKFYLATEKHQFVKESDMGDKTQTDSVFALSVRNSLQEKLVFLANFVQAHQITNQAFIAWQRNHLQYSAAQEILFYPFAGKINRTINQKQLLSLLGDIPIENISAFNNSAYYKFLSSLGSDQQIMINVNPIYDQRKLDAGKNTIGIYLDEIDQFAKGLARELFYYEIYVSRGRAVAGSEQFSTRFKQVITHPQLRRLMTEGALDHDGFKSFAVLERLKALKVSPSLKQKLINLFEGYKGHHLYIDFWGDWCGPCMSEMPNYPRLIKALEGKPIRFLFLSAFTTEASMLAIKEKYKINGDFVNLSKDEVSMMNNVFDFHGYPSHFMVNRDGQVLSRLSQGPSASTIEAILKKEH